MDALSLNVTSGTEYSSPRPDIAGVVSEHSTEPPRPTQSVVQPHDGAIGSDFEAVSTARRAGLRASHINPKESEGDLEEDSSEEAEEADEFPDGHGGVGEPFDTEVDEEVDEDVDFLHKQMSLEEHGTGLELNLL